MQITDEHLARVNSEPVAVGIEVCKLITEAIRPAQINSYAPQLLEVTLFLFAAGDAGLIPLPSNRPMLEAGKVNPQASYSFIVGVKQELESIVVREELLATQRQLEARFAQAITSSFGYEMTEGDLKQVQSQINQLRDLINDCPDLDADHRGRLLKRLEQVQSELHKKLSTLDQIYCLGIEASIVAHKIGKNAKPMLAIAKTLMGISWRTHSHTEGLPSDTELPLLESADGPLGLE